MVSEERLLRTVHLDDIDGVADTDILHLDMMGSHLIVLNSSEAAQDLPERRSTIYGDRV